MIEAATLSLAWETDLETGRAVVVITGSGTIAGKLRVSSMPSDAEGKQLNRPPQEKQDWLATLPALALEYPVASLVRPAPKIDVRWLRAGVIACVLTLLIVRATNA